MNVRPRLRVKVMSGIVLLLLAAGCASGTDDPDAIGLAAEALSFDSAPTVPAALEVPAGNKLAFAADAEGDQIYVCQSSASSYAWTFKEPKATLFGKCGRKIGTHYAGPTWEARDGSKVTGMKLAEATPDASAIPWLLLKGTGDGGHGLMSNVTYVQRLDTAGGRAPQEGCDAAHVNTTAAVSYTATYYFYSAAAGGGKPSRH